MSNDHHPEQEWVTITADPDDSGSDDDNTIIQGQQSSLLQRQREEPSSDCHWKDDAILQAFQSAVASHDYDPTAHPIVDEDEDDDEVLTNAKKRKSSATATTTSWEPRPLPLPTWAIDVFLSENETIAPSSAKVAAQKSETR